MMPAGKNRIGKHEIHAGWAAWARRRIAIDQAKCRPVHGPRNPCARPAQRREIELAIMAGTNKHDALAAELTDMLGEALPGITVEVGVSDRWNRPCATFCWAGFAGLLPEERFQRLTRIIPEAFRTARMAGMIWLEMAPGESVEQFLALPRSEDLEPRELEIYRSLRQGGFFDLLAKALGGSAERNCPGDFTRTRAVIGKARGLNVSPDEACLVFIRHGVYCDCQVLQGAEPALAELYAGAA